MSAVPVPSVAPSFDDQLPPDSRGGGRAVEIVRGVQLMFAELGLASLTEVTLANGRRADVMAVGPKGEIAIVEVKSCLQDFRVDQKWPEYAPYCDRFYFAIDCDFPKERIPETCGLLVCDGFGGAVLREAEAALLSGARRKAVTLSFARLAAARLMRAGERGPAAAEPAID